MRRSVFLFFLSVILSLRIYGQVHVLPELGFSYFTNEFNQPYQNLLDFGAPTFIVRVLLANGERSGWSLETPVSIRVVTKMDQLENRRVVRRLGIQVPILIQYSYGAGAHDRPLQSRWGFTVGGGWGWFAQQARSINYETPVFKERLSFGGPVFCLGFRYRVGKSKWFTLGDQDVFPVMGLRFTRQVDLEKKQRDVGAIGVYLGIQIGK